MPVSSRVGKGTFSQYMAGARGTERKHLEVKKKTGGRERELTSGDGESKAKKVPWNRFQIRIRGRKERGGKGNQQNSLGG